MLTPTGDPNRRFRAKHNLRGAKNAAERDMRNFHLVAQALPNEESSA